MKSNKAESFPWDLVSYIIHTPKYMLLAIDYVPNAWINRIFRLFIYSAILYIYLKLFIKNLGQSHSFLKKYNVVLVMIPVLITLFCIGIVATRVGYAPKYMAVIFPLLILLFVIFDNYSFLFRSIIYVVISIYFISLLAKIYRHPVKTYDYISVANYIQKIEKPGEPILIYRPAIALPFKHYYTGKNRIIPIPYPVRFDSSYLINIKDTIELKQSIENIKPTSNSYLLLSDTTSYESKVRMNRDMVSDYLIEHYNIILDTLFTGWAKDKALRIREFKKNQD